MDIPKFTEQQVTQFNKEPKEFFESRGIIDYQFAYVVSIGFMAGANVQDNPKGPFSAIKVLNDMANHLGNDLLRKDADITAKKN